MKKSRYIFLFICIIPLMLIGMRLKEYQKEDAVYEKVRENVAIVKSTMSEEEGFVMPEWVSDEDFIDIDALKDINGDAVGYIKVEGTQIDYPVVRSKDKNEKYLKTDFYGNKSYYGTVFEDAAGGVEQVNTILHAHNMKSGSMFGCLKEYKDKTFRNDHKYIKYITNRTVYLYEVVCYFTASGRDKTLLKNLAPYGQEGFDQLKDKISSNEGIFYGDMPWGEHYITLATCEYTHKSGQCYVMGRLIGKVRY